MVSKACVVGIYQRKLEEIAKFSDIELTLIVPPYWKVPGGQLTLERAYTTGYRLQVEPIRFNGNFHLHHYPTLARWLDNADIVHIDEEPYNLATWHTLWLAQQCKAKTLFFSWQNLNRRLPPPFSIGEHWTLNHIDYALMGTPNAARIWKEKGYRGRYAIIPQFGVDPELFSPANRPNRRTNTIGFVGRLVPEKGVDLLIRTLPHLDPCYRLEIAGQGPERANLEALAVTLKVADRVRFIGQIASTAMPNFYHTLDVLALPSRTLPNWKEQFGRVLIEAMASGVPVIGSDSGDIPGVIGDTGLIFPEDNVELLSNSLQTILTESKLRDEIIYKQRERVLANFTHAQIAKQTVDSYRIMMS